MSVHEKLGYCQVTFTQKTTNHGQMTRPALGCLRALYILQQSRTRIVLATGIKRGNVGYIELVEKKRKTVLLSVDSHIDSEANSQSAKVCTRGTTHDR